MCNFDYYCASWAGPDLQGAGSLIVATLQFSINVGHFASAFDEYQVFWRKKRVS